MNEMNRIEFDRRFTASVNLAQHPLRYRQSRLQNDYFRLLRSLLLTELPDEITQQRLDQYWLALKGGTSDPVETMLAPNSRRFWIGESMLLNYLLLDAALILDRPEMLERVYKRMCRFLDGIDQEQLEAFYQALLDPTLKPTFDPYASDQLLQFRENQAHKQKKLFRVAVAATVSAGKSTFINAIMGKRLARSSQEACTGNITCFFNKAFDDHSVHLMTDQVTLNASKEQLNAVSWEKPTYVAAYFQSDFANQYQTCLIDTPGVDSAVHKEHGGITKAFLKSGAYDKVVYILSAGRLGTTAEFEFLNWMYMNVSREKVIFVLNKIDTCGRDDNLSESIQGAQKDLMEIGFPSPVVYPISAYMALLSKMKHNGCTLSRRELRKLDLFEQDFQMPDNVAPGYGNGGCTGEESEVVRQQKQCGLYGVEKQIFRHSFFDSFLGNHRRNMHHTEQSFKDDKPVYKKEEPPVARKEPEAMHRPKAYGQTDTKQAELGGNKAMGNRSGITSVKIMYNPYTLDTRVEVEGEKLAENSMLRERIAQTSHLQEWIEELPDLLMSDYATTPRFDIFFKGTEMDYYDVNEVLQRAEGKKGFSSRLTWESAKETRDKEVLIDQVFREIQQGPFPELKSEQLTSAYWNVKKGVFNVCVVATMSAGKSTFINALLGEKLMPSKQEACTAIITTIQDKQDACPGIWKARILNRTGKELESQNYLTYEDMQRFNEDRDNKGVAKVEVTGKIPFVQLEDVSLVLVDTPGPNNARCEEHAEVQRSYLKNNANSVVLFILDPAYGKTDEDYLLKEIAESMKTGGKQSRDRYIFVLNKLDDRQEEDGSLEITLKKVRKYLGKFGIENPNVYPAAALPALDIRLLERGRFHNKPRDHRRANNYIQDFNEDEILHFEQFAPLPQGIKEQIAESLKTSDESQTALIHTGVVSIEAAIRLYVQKYAKTMKIRDLVDTFHKQLEQSGGSEKYISELMQSISGDQQEREQIREKCRLLERNVMDGENAKQFRDRVNTIVDAAIEQVKDAAKRKKKECQEKFAEDAKSLKGRGELSMQEAQEKIYRWNIISDRLSTQLQSEVQALLEERLIAAANKLLEEYKEKLSSMVDTLDSGQLMGIAVDPFRLIGVERHNFQIDALAYDVQVKAGQEWVKNTNRKWFKPWTWFQEKGFYRTIFQTVQRVKVDVLYDAYQTSVEIAFQRVVDEFTEHATTQLNKIRAKYAAEFARLNGIVTDKLKDLQDATASEQAIADRIWQAREKCDWLQQIVEKVNRILEI